MTNNTPNDPSLLRWSVTLVDDPPGPSIGDLAELIELLGFNPWTFTFAPMSDLRVDGMVITDFQLSGPPDLVRSLRSAYHRHNGSVTPEPTFVNQPESTTTVDEDL